MKQNILDLTFIELNNAIFDLDIETYRARQIFHSVHSGKSDSFDNLKNIPADLKKILSKNFSFEKLKLLKDNFSPEFNTTKFLFETSTGQKIESVLISEKDRNTVCISTQVGCNVGCEFCATGKMGFIKNLKPGEIVDQIYQISKFTDLKPTNIVYMGMGEPFLNYENMLTSLKILTDERGLNIGSRRITVSTVGFRNKIKKFADDLSDEENFKIKNVKLALSLHSTDNGIREEIIPTSKKNRLPDLYEELIYFYRTTGTKITYEYIFFEGINDSDNDIKRLKKLSSMVPSNINIIPFHPIEFQLNKPLDIYNSHTKDISKFLSKDKLNDFITRLRNQKVVVNLRTSSGVDINAACGQLAVLNN
ncbi:MAG TPA: 23S rRNA (adenine(2503)-C(2))-methyltransferase RlmN [Ignavibacteria bacterium]|nr:23S rRNA (adenine(2503)-C(2))-methyltransferase RlmN [Ignavibacteria bacterium]